MSGGTRSPAARRPSDGSLAVNTTSILRHINAIRCLRVLKRSGVMSRSDLARELKLTRSTVGNAIKELLEADLVCEPPATIDSPGAGESNRAGRPSVGVALNAPGAYFVGLDISTTKLRAVLVDLTMTVVARFSAPVGPDIKDVAGIADRLASLAQGAIAAAGGHRTRVRGVGVSVPGLVGRDGRVAIAPFLGWKDIDLRLLLSERLGAEVDIRVCNDAVAVASAFCAVADRAEALDLLLVLMSEGIGSAIVRQGQVIDGFNGYAGEIGQMVMAPTVAGASSRTFQLLAGQRFFAALAAPGEAAADAPAWLADPKLESPGLDAALAQWAEHLAAGLLNAIWLLDPERIVLSGPLAPLYPRVAARVGAILGEAMAGLRVPPISVSSYGAEGAAVGAAAVIRETVFALPDLTEPAMD